MLLAVAGYDGKCGIYDIGAREAVSSAKLVWNELRGMIRDAKIEDDGSSAGGDSQKPLCEVRFDDPAPRNFIWALAFSGDSKQFAIGAWNASVQLFATSDLLAAKVEATRKYVREDRVYSVALDATGISITP